MGGDPFLGNPVHFGGAYLHLHALAAGTEHRGVQRLVHVRLGHGNEILEAPGHRFPGGVNDPEHRVAVPDRLDDNTERDQVMNLLEINLLLDDFIVNRSQVFKTPLDFAFNAMFGKHSIKLFLNICNVTSRFLAMLLDLSGEFFIDVRLEVFQRKVFEFTLQPADTEAVGQRGEDIRGLPGNGGLAFGCLVRQGAHVMQAVSKLDQDDPDIPRHRQKHFTKVLRLALFTGLESNLADLGDTIDHVGDLLTKLGKEFIFRDQGIFEGIV